MGDNSGITSTRTQHGLSHSIGRTGTHRDYRRKAMYLQPNLWRYHHQLNRVRTHMDTRTQWLLSKSMATKACRQRKTWALFSKITTHKDFSNPSRTFWQKSCQDSTLVPFLSIHLACSITSAFAAS